MSKFQFNFFFNRFALQRNYQACCKTSRASCHCRIISRRSRVTHATASRYFVSSLSLPHRLTSPVLFLHRASRHALFSINGVPLRDTSHVSRVTLCRFRGTSYYIGVISCLVTSPSARAIPLRCRPAEDGRLSSFLFPVAFAHRTHSASLISFISPWRHISREEEKVLIVP